MRTLRLLALLPILATGCASYVNGIHRQIDREERRQSGEDGFADPYAAYREQGYKHRKVDQRPIKNPNSISALNPASDVAPPIKRDYRQGGRASANDFVDEGRSGSLWGGASGSSLFTTGVNRRVGDIVIVNVLENLRGQISVELKRAFPEKEMAKKGPSPAAEGSGPINPAAQAAAADKGDELDTKVYDKISGVVAEEINKDYFLLRGKKEVIFRKEKRYIEVQALVARKDIEDNDSINSDKLLESRVLVMR